MENSKQFIPFRLQAGTGCSRARVDATCLRAIETKNASLGTPDFPAARDKCSRVLHDAYLAHVGRVRRKLSIYAGNQKKWWKLSSSLTLRKESACSIPALRRSRSDTWITDAFGKAELFADAFACRSALPTVAATLPPVHAEDSGWNLFLPIRERSAGKVLKALRVDSATGPDGLPARILRMCHRELAWPIACLCRMVLRQGAWPNTWKFHWLHPLYKRKAKWDPLHHRGLHLTSQLSKVVERILGHFFQPPLEASLAYGPRQFAYTNGRGCKDALAYNVCSWLLSFSKGRRVGLYCSDVSGAFDRVSTPHLMDVLRRCEAIPRAMLPLFRSWLGFRTSTVVVDGVHSIKRGLSNSVYQGTVWGPILWNLFFESARHCINSQGFVESVFADDCNSFRSFDGRESNASILAELGHCQAALHAWGRSMRVAFDGSKERFFILSPSG